MKTFLPLAVFLAAIATAHAQPMPHHFTSITKNPSGDAVLTLDGSVSNMFNLTGTISNQFDQMFDLYPVEASEDLVNWRGVAFMMRTNNNPAPIVVNDTNSAAAQRFYRTFTNQFLTFYPAPTGPFPVGTVDRVMVDPARTNLYRYTPPTNAFMVTFWYPASTPPAGTMPKRAFDRRLATDPAFLSGLDLRWTNILSTVVQLSFANAPLADSPAGFPVVLFAHGTPSYRKTFTLQAAELASHGYVVVSMDHPDCWATEFPNGAYLYGYHSGDPVGRHQDITFLINKLAELNNSDSFFGGRLDRNNIGVFGHSAGGFVINIARTNSQVNCAAIYDGTVFTSQPLQKPMLIMVGQTNSYYLQDYSLFSGATNNVSTFLQIQGAIHTTPTDSAWGVNLPWGRSPNRAISDCLLWFFDTYLKSATLSFPTNAEIYNLQKR